MSLGAHGFLQFDAVFARERQVGRKTSGICSLKTRFAGCVCGLNDCSGLRVARPYI